MEPTTPKTSGNKKYSFTFEEFKVIYSKNGPEK